MSEPISVRPAAWIDIERKLRRVPQYADETCVRAGELVVDPSTLRPLCRLARTYRLEGVRQLMTACVLAGLPLFRGAWVTSNRQPGRLVLPPLVEEHNSQLVIIDGLHRLFEAIRTGRRSVSVVVLRGELQRLPADTLNWSEVALIDHHTPRAEKFRNLDESVFRQIHEHIDQHH